jgi:hypothetical protein
MLFHWNVDLFGIFSQLLCSFDLSKEAVRSIIAIGRVQRDDGVIVASRMEDFECQWSFLIE